MKHQTAADFMGVHMRPIDTCVILQPDVQRVDLSGERFVVIASNEMRVVIGSRLRDAMELKVETTESPLDPTTRGENQEEIQKGLDDAVRLLRSRADLKESTKDEVEKILLHVHRSVWRAKFDLERPCDLPHMHTLTSPH